MKSSGGVCLIVLLPALAGTAACSPVAEEPGSETAQTVDPAGSIRLTIHDDSGDVIYEGVSGDLPEGFPADFPIPGGVIEQSNRLLVGGQPMWSLVVQTQAPYAETIAFFESQLPAAGWTVTGSREAEMDWGTTFFLRVRSADETITGSVSIEDRESGAPVTVNLSRNR
jgi:hypothetical protein